MRRGWDESARSRMYIVVESFQDQLSIGLIAQSVEIYVINDGEIHESSDDAQKQWS